MGFQVGSLSLGPVLALQGLYLRRSTPRLPEAAGPRAGCQGEGPELRVLILGDSAAAGVGATSQDDALSGRLVGALAQSFRVSWTLVARAGATTAGTTRHLARLHAEHFDVAVVSIGGNDVTARRRLARWLNDVGALTELLRAHFGVRHVVFSGIPPMHAFPGLPQPLRWYLGGSARRFDVALARWARSQADCEHVPIALAELRHFATDGLHPGPLGYVEWGELLARHVRDRVQAHQASSR